jgi:hypothetical protein
MFEKTLRSDNSVRSMQLPPRAYVSATSGRVTETVSMPKTASFTTIQQSLRARCTKLAWPKPLLVLRPLQPPLAQCRRLLFFRPFLHGYAWEHAPHSLCTSLYSHFYHSTRSFSVCVFDLAVAWRNLPLFCLLPYISCAFRDACCRHCHATRTVWHTRMHALCHAAEGKCCIFQGFLGSLFFFFFRAAPCILPAGFCALHVHAFLLPP